MQEADAISYAESVGAAHIYTSAKQNKGLDESFGELTTSKCDMLCVVCVCACVMCDLCVICAKCVVFDGATG